ncbi:hypothetical protein [Thermogutta sp.]|uniref:hypothetical protein n=1 Tax=Thermogutta sp. TaxID=1962930 RepID=UPI00321FA644
MRHAFMKSERPAGRKSTSGCSAKQLPHTIGILVTLLGVLVIVGLASGCRRSQSPVQVEEVEPLAAEPQPSAAQPQEPMAIAPIDSVTLRPGENVSRKVRVDRKGRTGAIKLEVSNLPQGIHAKIGDIPDGQSETELVLLADTSLGENELTAVAEVRATLGSDRASQNVAIHVPKTPLPDWKMPGQLYLKPGEEVPIQIELDRKGYTGPLSLRVEQLPEGVIGEPVSVPDDAQKVTLQLKAGTEAKEGEFSAQVVLAAGARTAARPIKLVIRKNLFAVDCFRVVTLKPGESRDVDIPIRRNGYAGPITFTFENLPEGVTLTASEVPAGATSVKFHFSVNPQAHERVRSVWVQARGNGADFRDAIVVRVAKELGKGFLPAEIGYDPEIAPLFRRGSFGGRLTAKSKAALCDAYGGTPESEQAVLRGLRWLAAHQEVDGRWSLKDYGRTNPSCDCHLDAEKEKDIVDSDTGATGLALLPFLGAGVTHESSPEEPPELARYRNGVRRGLFYLIRVQTVDPKSEKDGYLGGNTYAHAIATMALCEAYGLSGDERIQIAAQRAIKYLMNAQHKEGGWRYGFREAGDMSVVGWVFLAIRSGQLAGLRIDNLPLSRASRFLDSCAVGPEPYKLSEYCYQPGQPSKMSLTACGLLTRQYLGWPKDNPHLLAGCRKLMTQLPPKEAQSAGQLYYYYYATQVLHHMEGEEWDLWNHRMREHLIHTQETSGHREGSWSPEGTDWGNRGGRIYATSLALMILQEYYRHLPLYRPVPKGQVTSTSGASGTPGY